MTNIRVSQAFDLLSALKQGNSGRVFSVTFIKKDGTEREMQCRFGVKSYLKGGEWANGCAGKPSDHGLAVVFDMQKQAYRSFKFASLLKMKLNGQEYHIS